MAGRRAILCAALVSAWMATGCNHKAVDMTAPTSPAANEWIHLGPNPFQGKSLPTTQWKLVPNANQSMAEPMLQTVSWVQLTNGKASELTNMSILSVGEKPAPYLLRAVGAPVGTNGFEVGITSNGDVWVEGGALSHHALPMERRAIVVWLDHPPREVYVSFSVAE